VAEARPAIKPEDAMPEPRPVRVEHASAQR